MTTPTHSPTIRDVARLAGVSVATVSRYLNHTAPLAEDTAVRVQQAMDELHFSPHTIARNLATHRTSNIGLVMEAIGGDFFTPLLDGIIRVTQENDLNLMVFTGDKPGCQKLDRIGPGNTDGLLVFIDSLSPDILRCLHEQGHPVVLIHQSPPAGLDIPLVTVENKGGARAIVNHLIEAHGRKRFVFLRGPQGNEDAAWRETGFRDALKTHGLALDEDLVGDGEYDRFIARDSMLKIIQKGKPFDAVFACDDDSAVGALQALKESGLDVPGAVSLAGFDDQRLAPFLTPPLTTIHAPTEKVGSLAAETLLRLIRGEAVEPEILLPTQLVVRNSCGCP